MEDNQSQINLHSSKRRDTNHTIDIYLSKEAFILLQPRSRRWTLIWIGTCFVAECQPKLLWHFFQAFFFFFFALWPDCHHDPLEKTRNSRTTWSQKVFKEIEQKKQALVVCKYVYNTNWYLQPNLIVLRWFRTVLGRTRRANFFVKTYCLWHKQLENEIILGGHRAPFFRKWVRTLPFSTFLSMEWMGKRWSACL